jgi:glutamate formiminotransferase
VSLALFAVIVETSSLPTARPQENGHASCRMPIIECVPNVSEGRRPDAIAAITDAIRAVRGVRLLDVSSDASHNRSVLTLAGDAAPLKTAVVALCASALERIDLRSHSGGHPRLGAVDVVPFVPIEGVTMHDCVVLARVTAAEVAARFDLPVFLYEEAATSPTSGAASLKDSRRSWREPNGRPTSGRHARIPPAEQRSSARECRSSRSM